MIQSFLTKWKFLQIDAAGAGLCVVAGLLFYFAAVRPLVGQRETRAVQQAQVETQRQNAARLSERTSLLQNRLAEVRKALNETPIQLAPAVHINRRIARLADLADQNGLTVDEIQPGKPTSTRQYEMIPIRLLGSGSYRTWAAFLHQLPRTFPDTSVRSFELSADPGDPSVPATFRIDLVWHAAAGGTRARK